MRLALTIDFMFPDKSAHRFRPVDLGRRVTLPPPTFPPARSVSKSIPRRHSGQHADAPLVVVGSLREVPEVALLSPTRECGGRSGAGNRLEIPPDDAFRHPSSPQGKYSRKIPRRIGVTRLNRSTSPYALLWRDQPVS